MRSSSAGELHLSQDDHFLTIGSLKSRHFNIRPNHQFHSGVIKGRIGRSIRADGEADGSRFVRSNILLDLG
jgi:hypothetical protein